MFCLDDVDADTQAELLALLNRMRDRWLDAGKRKGPEATEWRGMIQVSPDGWIYRRGISLNYQVLRSMYHARRNHRLIEWRQLCAWIETLPYAFLMTDCG
jgi:hypothetical protein